MADITSNLSLHWKFNDGSGSNAADSSGNSRTGTLNNSPTWGTGQFGQACLAFNGSNSNVSRASYTIPTTGTFAIWANPARAANSGVDDYIFNAGGATLFQIRKFTDNNIYAGFFNGAEYRVVVAGTGNWSQSTWQQYVLTWTSGGTLTFYRNNTSLGTKSSVNSTLASSTIHAASDDAGAAGFSGSLQELRIYSRVLSADDLAALYAYSGAALGARPSGGIQDFGFGFGSGF